MPKILAIADGEELLKQLHTLQENHSHPNAEWIFLSDISQVRQVNREDIDLLFAAVDTASFSPFLQQLTERFPHRPLVVVDETANEANCISCVGELCDDVLFTDELTPALFQRCVEINLNRSTQRRQRHQAYADAERARLQTIIDESPIGILIMDTSGTVTMRNRHQQRFVEQYIDAQVLKKPASVFDHILPEDIPLLKSNLVLLLRDEHPDHIYDVTCRILTPAREQSSTMTLSINGTLLRDQNGQPCEILLTCLDISEQIEFRQQLQQTAEEKEALLMGLLSMQRELGDCRDVRDMGSVVLHTALAQCNIECGCCLIREGNKLPLAAQTGIPEEIVRIMPRLSMKHPIIEAILANDCYGKVHHTTELISNHYPNLPFHHVFTITMRAGDTVIGFLNLATSDDELPDDQARQILGILMHEAETFFTRLRYEEQMKHLYREMEQRVVDRTQTLQTKIKELHGLHGFSKLAEAKNATHATVTEGLIQILPDSLQRPDIACARIIIGNKLLQTSNFRETPWCITAEIKAGSIQYGTIDVGYAEERIPDTTQVFTAGEKRLIHTTASRLGRMIEREQTAAALADSEQQYRNLFYHLNDAAVLCEHQSGKIVDVNKAAVRLFRNAATGLMDQNLFALCPASDFSWNPKQLQQLNRDSKPLYAEGVIHTTNGNQVNITVNATQITIGNRPFLLVLMRDVTLQKRANLHKEILNDVFQLFSTSADREITHQELLNLISKRFHKVDMALFIYDREKDSHTAYVATDNRLSPNSNLALTMTNSFAGQAIRQCKPVWHDDIQKERKFEKYPIHKMGARSVLAIPILSKGYAIGAITAYTDHINAGLHDLIDVFMPVANAIAGEIVRKNAEHHIRRHDAILDAINYAAEQFINNPYDQADMSQVLAMLGYAANVDRVYIFENHTDEHGDLCMSQRFEWCATEATPEIDNPELQNLPYKDSFGRWAELMQHENSVFGNVCDFPAGECELLSSQNIQSLAVVPIFSDATWWGFLGFDDCKSEHVWGSMELEALRTAADVIGASVARQRSEEALRQSEEQLRLMFDKSLDIILIISSNTGKIVRANAASYRILGYEPEQLIGESISYILPLRHHEDFDNLPSLAQNETIIRTQKFIRFDGGLCSMDLTAATIPWENQYAVLVTLRDVSERELSEEILKRNEERYRRIFEESPVSLWERDYSRVLNYLEQLKRRGVDTFTDYFEKNPADLRWCMRLVKTIDVNHTSLSMFKADNKEDLLHRAIEIYGTENNPCFLREILALTKHKRDLNIECQHEDFEGNTLNLLMRWSVVPGFEQNYKRVLVSYIDITSQRRAEREAKLRTEQLMQAEKMVALGTLVAGVAHEINNPNSFVTLNVPLVVDAWEKAKPILDKYYDQHGDFNLGIGDYSEMREEIGVLLSDIMEGARRIRTIVKDLKDFARQSPSEAFDMVSINDIARSATTLLRNSIKKHTRQFSVSYGDNIPQIQANMQRLEQVLINLIINACQALANPDKAIDISTSIDSDTGEIHITVRDEGGGIAEEQLRHIMDPFFTTKRDSGGTGLGLSISSTIMEEHGGRLEFTSKLGIGTTATMILPSNPVQTQQV